MAPPPVTRSDEPVSRVPPPAAVAALVKAAPRDVQAALGAPDLRRQDGPAQVWLYAASANCRIDVVFYPEEGQPKVAHAAARVTPPVVEDACLKMVAAR